MLLSPSLFPFSKYLIRNAFSLWCYCLLLLLNYDLLWFSSMYFMFLILLFFASLFGKFVSTAQIYRYTPSKIGIGRFYVYCVHCTVCTSTKRVFYSCRFFSSFRSISKIYSSHCDRFCLLVSALLALFILFFFSLSIYVAVLVLKKSAFFMLLSWLVLLHFSNSKHAYTLVSFCLFFYYCCWSWARVYAKFTRWQKFMAPYTSLFSDSIRFSFSLWELHITWNAEVLKVEYTIDNCAPQLTNSSPSPFCRFFSRRYASSLRSNRKISYTESY